MPDDASEEPRVFEPHVDSKDAGNEWLPLGELKSFEGTCEIYPEVDLQQLLMEHARNANRMSAFVAMRIPTVTHNDLEPGMRKGKPYIRKSEELREAEAKWEAHLGIAKGRIEGMGAKLPLSGPLVARVQFLFEADERHPAGTPHADKPDLDNIEKTFWDAMCRVGLIEDDRLVFCKEVTKAYDRIPGVRIEIERW